LNNDNNTNNILIPIIVMDKHSNFYDIEWVLIVHIIHRNCDVGVSFSYNQTKDLFVATSIYLDKTEIESKHILIGLKYNYCKNLRNFSLKKLKFKTGKNAVIDDDDDIAIHNNSNNNNNNNANQQILKYKQLIQNEQRKRQQIKQQMIDDKQIFMQQKQNLMQERNTFYINQQQIINQNQIYNMQQPIMYPQATFNNNNNMNANQWYPQY